MSIEEIKSGDMYVRKEGGKVVSYLIVDTPIKFSGNIFYAADYKDLQTNDKPTRIPFTKEQILSRVKVISKLAKVLFGDL